MNLKCLFFAGLISGLAGVGEAQQAATTTAQGAAPQQPVEITAQQQAPEEAGAEKDPAFLKKLNTLKEQVRAEHAKLHGKREAKKGPDTAVAACAFRNKAVRAMAEQNSLVPCKPPLPLANDESFEVRQFIYARPRTAARIFTAELEIARSTDAYSYRAQAESLYGDLAGAEADLTEAIKISPQPALLLQRGYLYLRQRKHEQAIADFTRALEEGGPPTAYHSRAVAYFSKDDYAAAAEDLELFFKQNTDKDFAGTISRSRLCRGLLKHGFAIEGCAKPEAEGGKR